MKTALTPYLLAGLLCAGLALPAYAQLVPDGGTLTITNATNLPGNLTVGVSGGNTTLNIIAPGAVNNVNGTIGSGLSASLNTVTVQNAGAIWNNTGTLTVGDLGVQNLLVISGGGIVSNTTGIIGNNAGFCRAAITGAGSFWHNSGPLRVGRNSGLNDLVISNGATVASSSATIGLNAGGTVNSAIVTGPGSLWTNSSILTVGFQGGGNKLIISNGATVASSGATIGVMGLNNRITVTGTDSTWENGGFLDVGESTGSTLNRLLIRDGGLVTNTTCTIGDQAGFSENLVEVTGFGSSWTSSGLTIGNAGSENRMVVSNGAVVVCQDGSLGSQGSSSNNLATIAGPGSLWTNRSLVIGDAGDGNRLVVRDGSVVLSGFSGRIGGFGAINNIAEVTGAGSRWTIDNFTIGLGSSSTGNQLIVSNGGLVESDFADFTGKNGRALVTGSGSLWTNSSTLTIGNFANGNELVVSNSAVVGAQEADVGGGSGVGNTVRLAGGTVVTENGLTVNADNTLGGHGVVEGPLTIDDGGRLSPGVSFGEAVLNELPYGKIIINDTPVLEGDVLIDIRKSGATFTNDHIQVNSTLTYGGRLVVTNLGFTTLAVGDSFQLFDAPSYSGAFDEAILPELPVGLAWSVPETNGVLAVTFTKKPEIADVTRQPGQFQLTFFLRGFPGDNWELLTTTNLNQGIATWDFSFSGTFDEDGEALGFDFIDSAKPQKYFGIIVP